MTHDHLDIDTLQRCLQHAADMAVFLADNRKAIADLMIDDMYELPPDLDKDEYRELEQTLRSIERL